MNPLDYEYLRKLLRARSGLTLSSEKQYLVESRLLPLARKHGMASLAELVTAIKAGPQASLAQAVTEAMTTNESFFFRDKIPFEHFKNIVLPTLMAARAREKWLRIWCNACSTGQEPYSLAIILDGMREQLAGWHVEILATDLSADVLARAKTGLYSQFEVQRGLPIQMLVKYFTQVNEQWQIASDLRNKVTFRAFNLLSEFSAFGIFDLVFCRNVLIYFDQETKIGVLNRLAQAIAADGYLVLGAAETVVGLTDAFKPMRDHRGLYVVNPTPSKAAAKPAAPFHVASPPLAPAATHGTPESLRIAASAKR